MQIQQLRYLIAAAECGSFRAAASKLYISQSSLSVAIKDLEQELSTKVFNRTSRGITLTSAGVELLGYAKQVVEQVDLMLARYAPDRCDELRFSVSSQHYSIVVEGFGDFLDAHSGQNCDVQLRETYTNEVIGDVSEGRSEVGIIYLSNYNDRVIKRALDAAGLYFRSLFIARPHVLVAGSSPLSTARLIRPEDLEGLVRFEHDQGIESSSYYSEEPLSTIPCNRKVVLSDNNTLAKLLAEHDGYTISTGVFPTQGALVSIPLDTDEIMNVGYIAREDVMPSELREEFLGFVSRRVMDYADTVEPSSTAFDYVRGRKARETRG